MFNHKRISSFTKYSSRFYHFTDDDCARIKSYREQPYGWFELLSDQYGNPTTDDVFDPKVLNALNEGRNCFTDKDKVYPNCYLASHNGEKGILIVGVDNVLFGTNYEKTDRFLIDQDKLIARSCDKAEMDDEQFKYYAPKHPQPIDPKLKICVRTGFLVPKYSVGIFIFAPEYSIVMEYYTGRVLPEPISKIPNMIRFLFGAMEVDFNPIWKEENMLAQN